MKNMPDAPLHAAEPAQRREENRISTRRGARAYSERCCKSVDKKERDALILKYTPLVKNIVGRMAVKLPPHAVDREDLLHVGIIGLISALEKYDTERNVQFETYARFRIKGAVLDELRKRDWAPRSARVKDSKLEEAFWELQKSLERQPTEEEMAMHLGIDLDEYYRMIDDARSVSLVSVEDLPVDYLDQCAADGLMSKVEQGNALETLMGAECRKRLKDAIDALPEKERLVLSLYYYEELMMKEIGRVLDLTESRVCQLHAQATLRLRSHVKDLR